MRVGGLGLCYNGGALFPPAYFFAPPPGPLPRLAFQALIAAGKNMQDDGWWWDGSAEGETNLTSSTIKGKMSYEMVTKMVRA